VFDLISSLGLLSQAFRREFVRVTFYTLVGITSSGQPTGFGVAACSDWIPLNTWLAFSDGMRVRCSDRGLGGQYWAGWVDVWAPSYLWGIENVQKKYGD
jgi:hypothetical protein